MKTEERIEMWGMIIFLLSLVIAFVLTIYAGLATKKYSFDSWGENGILWGYIFLAIAAVFQSFILKLFLDGIGESIRLKRRGLENVPDIVLKNCPACDEPIREAAKVCRYCRCVLKKPESSKQPT
ncbi:MAG: hypothetical protein ACI4NJ_00795 [Cellvibrio sp.]